MPDIQPGPLPTPEKTEALKELVAFLVEKKVLAFPDAKRVLNIQAQMDKRFGTLAALKAFVSLHDVIFILYRQTEAGTKLGELAVKSGLMTGDQVREVLLLQANPSRLFLEILVRTRTVQAAVLQKAMREFQARKGAAGGVGRLLDGVDLSFAERPAKIDADKLKNHLRRLKDLATLPGVVHRVLGLLQNPHVEMHEVALVIEGDPALSIRLLRLVNSAFFGLSTKVSSVHKALITLGVKNVQKIIITASILEKFQGISQQDAEEYWRHSLLTSRWTKRLLELQGQRGEILEDGGMAGLLHDTGRLAIWQFFAEANAEVQKLIKGGRNAEEAEREVLSMPHSEIGAFLFQIWNFPAHLLQASCYHHLPVEELGRVKDLQPTTPFVSAACRLAHLPMVAQEDGTEKLDVSSLEPEFLAFHRLTPDALVSAAPAVLKEAGEMLANFVSQAKND